MATNNSSDAYAKAARQAREALAKRKELFESTKGFASSYDANKNWLNKVYAATGQYERLLSGPDRDAFLALESLFNSYGLGSLAKNIYQYVQNGYSSDTISLLLQDTPEYKQRFAANQARVKAGMSALSPAEYLATESSYRQIMRASGLPEGFYDNNTDFTDFLSKDVSPTELQSRVDLATQATVLASGEYKNALTQMGIGQGELAAYFLDPNKALPYIQKAAATASIGAEALQRGLNFDTTYAEELATRGITRDAAATGYSQISSEYGTLMGLGSIYGGGWSQRQAEEDVFTGGVASQQRKKLIGQEAANFSGAVGGGRSGLAGVGGAR